MNSFSPDASASWNIFIKHFDDVPSFDILKKHINTFFRPNTKSIFGIHDPVGLRYLFQKSQMTSSFRLSSHSRRKLHVFKLPLSHTLNCALPVLIL